MKGRIQESGFRSQGKNDQDYRPFLNPELLAPESCLFALDTRLQL